MSKAPQFKAGESGVKDSAARTQVILTPGGAVDAHARYARQGVAESTFTVLVVDDDGVVRRIIRSLLEGLKMSVLEAPDASTAIEVISAHGLSNVHCVVTDYQMPDQTGVALTRQIKKQDENISVVLLSIKDDKEVVKQGLRAGVFDFVEKQLLHDRLTDVVQAAIQQTVRNRKNHKQRYSIEGRIGEGGLGQVFRAWDAELKRPVALKRLNRSGALSGDDMTQLFGEAIRLARLQHPNIVNIFDCGVDSEGPFIVMELLQGKTLEDVVSSLPPWSSEQISEFAHQCLDALIAAHQINLLHLDITPSNIILLVMDNGSFHAKILDFGLSQVVKTQTPQSTNKGDTFYGSPLYASPEIFQNGPVDCRTDLYGLGCSLYLAAAKVDAFSAFSMHAVRERHINHDVIDLYQLRPDLGKTLCSWIMHLIESSPDDRPRTALAAKTALASILRR